MIDNKNCKIVQDLFPSYIENLTDEETNKFIEEHLKECEECKKILENMKKDLESNNKQNKIETNYIKKYSKKMKILKAIILVIFIIFIASTARKFIIITSLSNKANKYINASNYYNRTYSYYGDTLDIVDVYYKDGKTLWKVNNLSESNNWKKSFSVYSNGETSNIYVEQNNEKMAELGKKVTGTKIYNYFDTDNFLQLLMYSITATVKETNCNGKDCYYIMINSNEPINGKNTDAYIDKETGLVVRKGNFRWKSIYTGKITDTVVDYYYEFDTVTDDIFIEPDLSEYTISEHIQI